MKREDPAHLVTPDEADACAREALQFIGLCQDFGFLLAVDPVEGRVLHHADNLGRWLPLPAGSAHPRLLEDVCDTPRAELLAMLAAAHPTRRERVDIVWRGQPGIDTRCWEAFAHRAGPAVVIEVTPWSAQSAEPSVPPQWDRTLADAIQAVSAQVLDDGLDTALATCTQALRVVSGYDRVMIYRFLPDWSGEVIAEAAPEGAEQRFLGLRFPASDIPPQARALYTRNLLRVVADAECPPVAIRAVAGGAEPVDLSLSLLRQPSDMHVRYMRNMGVRATLTISLMNGDALWGMAAFHHGQPKAPPLELRTLTQMVCALIAQGAMTRIDAIIRRGSLQRQLGLEQLLLRVREQQQAPAGAPQLLGAALREAAGLLAADEVGLYVGGQWIVTPDAPPPLLQWLLQQAAGHSGLGPWHADRLSMAGAAEIAGGTQGWSGALACRLPTAPSALLLLLRRECTETVRWAGQPGKLTTTLPDGSVVLGPRASFAQWTEQVQGSSEPWTDWEREAAQALAKAIDHQVAQRERKLRAERDMLANCIDQLSDMVVITGPTSHSRDLQVLYVNETYVRLTGYSREEVIGRHPGLLQGPESDPAVKRLLREAIEQPRPCSSELVNYTKHGEPYRVRLNLTPLLDAEGRVTHFIGVNRMLDADAPLEVQTDEQGERQDAITRLPSRVTLLTRLGSALAARERFDRNSALLVVNLDRFSAVNETAGRTAGDELLRLCAQRLVAMVRREDTVVRLGNDEFAILLAALPADEASAAASLKTIAEEVVARLASPFELSDRMSYISASVGAVLLSDLPERAGPQDALNRAQAALSRAKAAAGNHWRRDQPGQDSADAPGDTAMAGIADALQRDALALITLPRWNAERQPAGAELSLSWLGPAPCEGRPQALIDAGTRNPAAVQLTLVLIDRAAGWLASTASANATPAQTCTLRLHPDLLGVAAVRQALQAAGRQAPGAGAGRLRLKLPASMLGDGLPDDQRARADLAQELGLPVEVEVGLGAWPALDLLAALPLAAIVLTAPLTQQLMATPAGVRQAAGCLALARSLGSELLAEGTDGQATFDRLLALGLTTFSGGWREALRPELQHGAEESHAGH